jgi:predicted DNA-binding protein (MmcQ/YjbR family)
MGAVFADTCAAAQLRTAELEDGSHRQEDSVTYFKFRISNFKVEISMNLEWLREYCLSLPHATEKMQWECLLFCVGGKMFLLAPIEPDKYKFSFKCSDETFHELLEREDVIPAPYLARAKWVAATEYRAIEPAELRECIRESYELVLAKLPKKTREKLATTPKKKGAAKRASLRI